MRYLLVLSLAVFLGGCTGDGPTAGSDSTARRPDATPTASNPRNAGNTSGGGGGDGAVAAIVDGRTVPYDALRPMLAEAAGGQVLGEYVIDRQLDAALREANLTLGADDLARERRLLTERLSDDPDTAARLLTQLRERRGLGDERFRLLLRRNAGLRKLVANEVQVTDALVREAYTLRYGERYSARMILTPTLNEANRAMQRVRGGEPFAEVAIDLSTDVSRNQGGLLPDISVADATFPKALRDAVSALEPGQVGGPVTLEGGFAILKLERKIPASAGGLASVRGELERAVRLQAEASAMQRRIRVMLEQANVTVLDADLNNAWQRQRDAVLGAD